MLLLFYFASTGMAEVIVFCGFEPAGDSWAYTLGGGGIVNTATGENDFPPNQRIHNGAGSWLTANTTSTLTLAEVLLSGWTSVAVKYRVSSTATGSSGGQTPGDILAAYVATTTYSNLTTPQFGNTADITLKGYGAGATWGYNSGAQPQYKNLGWGGTLQPSGSGLRTTDGYTDFAVLIPDGYRSLALKLYVKNSGAGKFWNLDDVQLVGQPTLSSSRWWDANGANPGSGGSGIWDNTIAVRWAETREGGNLYAWNSSRGDNAVFAHTAGTVTIAAGTLVAARSLSFLSDGYVIASGDSASRLALTAGGSDGPGPSTIDVADANHTAMINARIVTNPGVGLRKTGGGTLVLGKANGYQGPTVIQEGTVRISAANNLGTVGAPVHFAGGALQLSANVNLDADHPFVLLHDSILDTGAFTCFASTAGWDGRGTLTKRGTGVLSLSGANTAFQGALHIEQGTLRLTSAEALLGCTLLDLEPDTTLNVTALAEGFQLGTIAFQRLSGSGEVRGNLIVGQMGLHDLGHSPGVQYLWGNYVLGGRLRVEISGPAEAGYPPEHDQLLICGDEACDVSLGGTLEIQWSGCNWATSGMMLWLIRNETAGELSGMFDGLEQGAIADTFDGYHWRIFYGADAQSGRPDGGNDVLLLAWEVPEPPSAMLLLFGLAALLGPARRLGRRT